MGGYIVLCDHNSKWAEKFTDEAIKRNIQTVVVESIAEIEDETNGRRKQHNACMLINRTEGIFKK